MAELYAAKTPAAPIGGLKVAAAQEIDDEVALIALSRVTLKALLPSFKKKSANVFAKGNVVVELLDTGHAKVTTPDGESDYASMSEACKDANGMAQEMMAR